MIWHWYHIGKKPYIPRFLRFAWGRIPTSAGCCPDLDGKWHICCGSLVAKDLNLKSQLHGVVIEYSPQNITEFISRNPTTNMKSIRKERQVTYLPPKRFCEGFSPELCIPSLFIFPYKNGWDFFSMIFVGDSVRCGRLLLPWFRWWTGKLLSRICPAAPFWALHRWLGDGWLRRKATFPCFVSFICVYVYRGDYTIQFYTMGFVMSHYFWFIEDHFVELNVRRALNTALSICSQENVLNALEYIDYDHPGFFEYHYHPYLKSLIIFLLDTIQFDIPRISRWLYI